MATAALRAILVVAAIVLGVFILSKMIPTGTAPPPVTPEAVETTPPAEDGGTGTEGSPPPTRNQQEPRDPSGVEVQVLNGTDVTGLAADTAELLEAQGYQIVTVDDAEGEHDRTTIFFHPKARADAQQLKDSFFPNAALEQSEPGVDVDLTVVLAEDYASEAQQGEATPSPEES